MCKLAYKILSVITILVALALAVAATIWHEQGLNYILFVSRFFDVILPVLAVGALLKYLFGCHHHHNGGCGCQCGDKCQCSCCKDGSCCKEDSCSCTNETMNSSECAIESKKPAVKRKTTAKKK